MSCSGGGGGSELFAATKMAASELLFSFFELVLFSATFVHHFTKQTISTPIVFIMTKAGRFGARCRGSERDQIFVRFLLRDERVGWCEF